MRSPAAAIAWEYRQRHRWGWSALIGYLVVLAAIDVVDARWGLPVDLDTPAGFAVAVVVPTASAFMYLLAVFSFGLAGDLAARRSIYPARMFTLPVSSSALAGWPMVYGAAAMVVLWTATRLFAQWPPGMSVPVAWPALLAAVLLAWTQALTWLPYGLPGLRVVVTVAWLVVIDTVTLVALHFQAAESVMLAILAPHLPLAYLAARLAVTRARRGDVPDWRGRFVGLRRLATPIGGRRGFGSPERAQAWLEWRRHGRSLPALVAILLPFELALLFVARDAPVLVFAIILGALLTPPFLAVFAAATLRKARPATGDGYGLTPFMATRPLTSAALVAAKLEMAWWSTLAAWLLVIVAIPAALAVTGTEALVADRVRRFVEFVGTPRAIVFAALSFLALVSFTWKQLVQSLYVGLSGRPWAPRASVFLGVLLLSGLGPMALWIVERGAVRIVLWDALPWVLSALAVVKLCSGGWVASRLHDAGLVSDRTLVTGAACWLVVVLAVHWLLVWFVDTAFVPSYLLLLVAILGTPLARVSAAPLALAWNRHR